MNSDPTLRSDIINSTIRTIVPLIVGAILSLLGQLGVTAALDEPSITAAVTTIVTPFVTAIYYIVVRYLEVFRNSKYGVLLGRQSRPYYPSSN